MHCPANAWANENDRADWRLKSKRYKWPVFCKVRSTEQIGTLSAGKSQGHITVRSPRGEKRRKRIARWFYSQGREKIIDRQPSLETVANSTLGTLLRDGVGRIWAFLSVLIPFWTEVNLPIRTDFAYLCLVRLNGSFIYFFPNFPPTHLCFPVSSSDFCPYVTLPIYFS